MDNKTPSEFLNESSLSRLWRHNESHDAAAFTAYRNAPDCGSGDRYTNKQNAQRNKTQQYQMVKGQLTNALRKKT